MSDELSRTVSLFFSTLSASHYVLLGLTVCTLFVLPRLSKAYKRILPLLIVWSINEIGAIISAIIFRNNSPVYHVFTLLGTLLILYYYYPQLSRMRYMKMAMIWGISLFCMLWIFNVVFFQPILLFPSNAIMFSTVLILFFVLSSFRDMLNNPINAPILTQERFWINTGILIFYTSSFFFFFVHNYLQRIGQFPSYLKDILQYTNAVWLFCLAMALLSELGILSFKRNVNNENGI